MVAARDHTKDTSDTTINDDYVNITVLLNGAYETTKLKNRVQSLVFMESDVSERSSIILSLLLYLFIPPPLSLHPPSSSLGSSLLLSTPPVLPQLAVLMSTSLMKVSCVK